MIERILIALDGSPESEEILGEVERIAGSRTSLDLLHVIEDRPREVPGLGVLVEDLARPYLERVARRLPGRSVGIHLRRGKPEDEISRAARSLNADLIALTTHARKGLSRIFMGSVAESVVRKAAIPVLMTRPHLARPRKPLERLLVPIDGSPESKQIFESVRHFAKDSDVEVILLQVVENLIAPDPMLGTSMISMADLVPDPTSSLRAYAYKLEREGLKTRSMVVFGAPADQILEQAKILDVDLIAMASTGRPGLSRAIRGSVSFKVLRHTDRAVLLHRVTHEAPVGEEGHSLHVQEEGS
ncbi:MAG TPA: universal stress protein [Planctomycetota bacterium]|nr:universal stress protein [Planctomycetota bacterium]